MQRTTLQAQAAREDITAARTARAAKRKADQDAIVKSYTGGLSIREVAAKHGCSYGKVHRILTFRVQVRARGGRPKTSPAAP